MATMQISKDRGWKIFVATTVSLLLAMGVMAIQSAPAFAADPMLTVNKTGGGTVTSTPSDINCGTDCSEAYPVGFEQVCEPGPNDKPICTNEPVYQEVTPNASTLATWQFGGWGGACSGTGACTVTMDSDETVSATFRDVEGPSIRDSAQARACNAARSPSPPAPATTPGR